MGNINVRLASAICLISINSFENLEAAEDIDNIVVTGHNITFDDTNTQSFNEEYIFEKAEGNLIDFFRGISGIDVSQVGGDGGITFLSIRGGEPNFTTILIDGVAVNNSSNSRGGAFDFSSLDPAMIERIEVVRGPASPEIGSGAVSGIINLITHKATEQEKLSARSYYGTNNSYNISTSYARPIGQKGDMSIGGAYTNGGDDIEGNKLQRLNLNFGGGTVVSDVLKIRTNVFYSEIDAENFPEDSGGPILSIIRENQVRNSNFLSANANISYQVNDKLAINSIYNLSRIKEDVLTPAIAPGVLDGVPPYLSDTQCVSQFVSIINS
ncbi:MAG: TonB-dependent receptor [Kordiimonadaceae bacterium]|jgi:vitamin B12 transporter|nr:TonB-dependent receptor [Kordiimonadaceae bacterium]MBT6034973.1 TonB-dependent receptor [Kordiimonadaceae bacterium]MBT6329188.1 TonB-dependent receptor [Kordiimonadaceae bacterium]MBT7581709.1 TonB-dependent receptor [Kordiimonadaceae bacterium]